MSPKDKDKDALRCSFCGKSQGEVLKLISGPSVRICDDCVRVCNEILADEEIVEDLGALGPTLTQDVGAFTCPKCRTTFTLHSQHVGLPDRTARRPED